MKQLREWHGTMHAASQSPEALRTVIAALVLVAGACTASEPVREARDAPTESSTQGTEATVEVPGLFGKATPEAKVILQQLGLKLTVGREIDTLECPSRSCVPGATRYVHSQDPLPGTETPVGSRVVVTVATFVGEP